MESSYAGKLGSLDTNHDGVIDVKDCPFPLGSTEAKAWWTQQVLPAVKAAKTSLPQEVQDKYGEKLVGAYKGRPLVPGVQGQDQGDMSFVIDSIRVTQGLSSDQAFRIASKAREAAFGKL